MIKNHGTINLYLGYPPKDRRTISIEEYTEFTHIPEVDPGHSKLILEMLQRLERNVDKLADIVEKLNKQ